VGGNKDLYIVEKQDRGYVWLLGAFADKPYAAPPGTYPVTLAGLLAPTTSKKPGEVICAAAASIEVTAASQSLRSLAAKSLGACPGIPTTGSLSLCNGSGCTGPAFLTGDIGGIAPTDVNVGVSLGQGQAYVDLNSEDFTMRGFTDAPPEAGKSGTVDLAIIFTKPSGAYGGAVFCAGAGSTWDYTSDLKLSLNSFGKLGSCVNAPGDEALTVCL
jgi:hypothetical protein